MATKAPSEVRRMFDEISPTYDLLNHAFSMNIDKRWRTFTAKQLISSNVNHVLDCCAGTGDLALAMAAQAKKMNVKPVIIAGDFTPSMMRIAKGKFAVGNNNAVPVPSVADTLNLPFQDSTFDVVTVAFGIRNVADLSRGLGEMVRVCRPGGRVAVLEFSQPRIPLLRAGFDFYFKTILPAIGSAVTGTRAYMYLSKSVAKFPDTAEFSELLGSISRGPVESHRLCFGIATLYIATVRK